MQQQNNQWIEQCPFYKILKRSSQQKHIENDIQDDSNTTNNIHSIPGNWKTEYGLYVGDMQETTYIYDNIKKEESYKKISNFISSIPQHEYHDTVFRSMNDAANQIVQYTLNTLLNISNKNNKDDIAPKLTLSSYSKEDEYKTLKDQIGDNTIVSKENIDTNNTIMSRKNTDTDIIDEENFISTLLNEDIKKQIYNNLELDEIDIDDLQKLHLPKIRITDENDKDIDFDTFDNDHPAFSQIAKISQRMFHTTSWYDENLKYIRYIIEVSARRESFISKKIKKDIQWKDDGIIFCNPLDNNNIIKRKNSTNNYISRDTISLQKYFVKKYSIYKTQKELPTVYRQMYKIRNRYIIVQYICNELELKNGKVYNILKQDNNSNDKIYLKYNNKWYSDNAKLLNETIDGVPLNDINILLTEIDEEQLNLYRETRMISQHAIADKQYILTVLTPQICRKNYEKYISEQHNIVKNAYNKTIIDVQLSKDTDSIPTTTTSSSNASSTVPPATQKTKLQYNEYIKNLIQSTSYGNLSATRMEYEEVIQQQLNQFDLYDSCQYYIINTKEQYTFCPFDRVRKFSINYTVLLSRNDDNNNFKNNDINKNKESIQKNFKLLENQIDLGYYNGPIPYTTFEDTSIMTKEIQQYLPHTQIVKTGHWKTNYISQKYINGSICTEGNTLDDTSILSLLYRIFIRPWIKIFLWIISYISPSLYNTLLSQHDSTIQQYETEVRYTCDKNALKPTFVSVTHTRVCKYVFHITSAAICDHSLFMPTGPHIREVPCLSAS